METKKKSITTWGHRLTGNIVKGSRLEPGDIIEATDVYDSSSGNWEPAPCPGVALGAGTEAVWVRPARVKGRGFASMTTERRAEISRMGGMAAHRKGNGRQWTSEEAREAGRKGGTQTGKNRRTSVLRGIPVPADDEFIEIEARISGPANAYELIPNSSRSTG